MQKIGENMNRKIMILMVAVVATVLPAVAVADVMITGSVQGLGVGATDAFTVQPGSNYMSAHHMTGFTWTSSAVNESEDLGNISLGVMSNETIYEINVLDINFTTSGYFNLTVFVPSPGDTLFPTDTAIYFSTSPFTMSTSGISPSAHTVSLYGASGSSGVLVNMGHVTKGTTIYVAFLVGAGTPVNGSFDLAMSFTS